MNHLTDPLDDLHRDSLAAIERIRKVVEIAKSIVADWEPAPPPKAKP